MTFADFLKEFTPLIKYFGADHFPKIVLERMHFKTRDLTREQFAELMNLLMDQCDFAPKVPKVVELANLIRAKHRELPKEHLPEHAPMTSEVGKQAIAQIRNIFGNVKGSGGA